MTKERTAIRVYGSVKYGIDKAVSWKGNFQPKFTKTGFKLPEEKS